MTFTNIELQKRFCEGFAFFPFKALEQYGNFIYKNYSRQDSTRKVLDWCSGEVDFSEQYAQKLLQKLKLKDIPAADVLLDTLQSASTWLKERFDQSRKHPLRKKLPEGMENYHRLVSLYQQQVQLNIATQLAAIPQLPSNGRYNVNAGDIHQVEAVMQEFIQGTDSLCAFLKDCIGKKKRTAPEGLAAGDITYLLSVIKVIASFRYLQERNIYLLEAWKMQLALHSRRRAMN